VGGILAMAGGFEVAMTGLDMTYIWSLLGFIVMVRSMVPKKVTDAVVALLRTWWTQLMAFVNPFCCFHIFEYGSSPRGYRNRLYDTVQTYLRGEGNFRQVNSLQLRRSDTDKHISFSLLGLNPYSLFFLSLVIETRSCFSYLFSYSPVRMCYCIRSENFRNSMNKSLGFQEFLCGIVAEKCNLESSLV
jgi:hypothetical protein